MNIKRLTKLVALLGLLLVLAMPGHAQLLTQTTLSAAVTGGGPYSGVTQQLQTFVTLASITGLQPALLGTQVQSIIYVDKEAMGVISVPASASLPVGVIRGQLGTPASAHASGAMVIYGQVNLLGNNAFFQRDPDPGSCTTTFPQQPWINVLTGMQWLCSQTGGGGTGQWTPGFNNPGTSSIPIQSAGTFASVAGTNAVPGPLFAVSGTNAIVTWTVPFGFNTVSGGCFTTIPTGIFTWTAAGNISVAGTTTAITQNVTWCWNPVTSKWTPSRVA